MNKAIISLVPLALTILSSCGSQKADVDDSKLIAGHTRSQEAIVRVGNCLAVQYAPQQFVTFNDCLADGNVWKQDGKGIWQATPYNLMRVQDDVAFIATDTAISPTSIPVRLFSDYPFTVDLEGLGQYAECSADRDGHHCYTQQGLRGAPLVRTVDGYDYLIGINRDPEPGSENVTKICPGGCAKGFASSETWGI